MQQRRSSNGRPSGTDGSDFSYRMVVDSRYTKVAKGKSLLSQLLLIQAVLLLGNGILMLFSKLNGDAPELVSSSAAAILLVALLLGEYGRRRSRTSFLKIYIVLSTLSAVLFVARAVNNKLILQFLPLFVVGYGITGLRIFSGQIKSSWEAQKVPFVEAVVSLAGLVLQIFAASTTLSLVSNMSPPKKSS